MSKFTKGAFFRVIGNNPRNTAGEHNFPVGELVEFLEIDRDGDYAFESVRTQEVQYILPSDVEPVDDDVASPRTKLEAVTAEVAALRTQIKAALAVKPAAAEIAKAAERSVMREDVRVGAQFRVAFEPNGREHDTLNIGDIIEIVRDDGDDWPEVRRIGDGVVVCCGLIRLAHIEKPAPKIGDLFRVLRNGRTEAKGCWFNYNADTIVELVSECDANWGDAHNAAHFRQVGGTPNQRPDYAQIIWFVDLEPYSGSIPATEISQDAARQMLDTLKELVSKAEAVIAKVEGRE